MTGETAVRVVLAGFALYLVGIALLALIAPGTFFEEVGPFGVRNDHYTRDGATFELALGIGAAVAVRRPTWRVPLTVILLLQFAFHALNHLVDVHEADPGWLGPADLAGLTLGSLLLGWTWWQLRAGRAPR